MQTKDIVKRSSDEQLSERPAVAPAVDIYENNDEFLIVADVPGATTAGLDIRLEDERLTLLAKYNNGDAPLRAEYRPTDYRRTFVLPDGIDRDKAHAKLESGVLYLHIPKAPAVKPRQISVTAG